MPFEILVIILQAVPLRAIEVNAGAVNIGTTTANGIGQQQGLVLFL
jgi:hypothetical protein